jgi:hypothetical protein
MNHIKLPNSEKNLYLNPGLLSLLLSYIPNLFDLLNDRVKMFLFLELKYFPLYFYKVLSI